MRSVFRYAPRRGDKSDNLSRPRRNKNTERKGEVYLMQLTDKQLEANSPNARYSTGPKSENGKHNSSRNATRHGLFAIQQSTEAHRQFTTDIIADLNPSGALENQTAQLIAEDHYRLNRIREIETAIFAQGDPGTIFLQHAKELERLTLYESRISRNIQRNLAQLKSIQADRKAECARQMSEAQLLAQVSLSQNRPYHPEQDGFVFSAIEINTAIDRNNRLQTARNQPAVAV